MTDPTVCCVMLMNGRGPMVRRAIKSFRDQTYTPRMLLIWDTSTSECIDQTIFRDDEYDDPETPSSPRGYLLWYPEVNRGASIGELRNDANGYAVEEMGAQIICTWDSDDHSHANRISEQVALLQASGAECVGYNGVLFWDTRVCSGCKFAQPYIESDEPGRWHGTSRGPHRCDSSAYIYRNYGPDYCIGSSMMYTRAAWERVKFDHINQDEDGRFLLRVKSVGVSGIGSEESRQFATASSPEFEGYYTDPRMVCSIHGGNTSHYNPEGERNSYHRSPEWDSYCQEQMKL